MRGSAVIGLLTFREQLDSLANSSTQTNLSALAVNPLATNRAGVAVLTLIGAAGR
jgi:hypothetical protein